MNIMLIEDDVVFALLTKNNIQKLGYQHKFEQYSRSERALGKLKVSKPDVILLDHNLDGVNGIDSLPIFRELCPDTKIVVVTSNENMDKYIAAFENGADEYFKKDNEVFIKIRNYIQTLIEENRPTKSKFHKFMAYFGINISKNNHGLSKG